MLDAQTYYETMLPFETRIETLDDSAFMRMTVSEVRSQLKNNGWKSVGMSRDVRISGSKTGLKTTYEHPKHGKIDVIVAAPTSRRQVGEPRNISVTSHACHTPTVA